MSESIVSMAAAMTDAEILVITEWLGERRGRNGRVVVPANVQASLVELATRLRGWSAADIPDPDELLTDDDIRLWGALFEDMRDDAGGINADYTGSVFLRFVLWMRAGTLSPTQASSATTTAATAAVAEEVTAECKADMLAQGALAPEDLMWLELGVLVARSATTAELKGGQHAGPAQMMEGGKMAKKHSVETIDQLLAAAKKDGDLNPVENHFARTLAAWSGSGHRFAAKASGLVMLWWQTTKRTNDNDVESIIDYAREYRSVYMGRGFPVVHDSKIQATVSAAMMKRMMEKQRIAAERHVTAGVKDVVRDVGGGGMSDAVAEQLKEIVIAMKSQQRQLDSVRTEVQKQAGKNDKYVPHDQRTCYICGESGHITDNCPKKK